eukprot:1157715-Pelagomonas_calceolata.AAC.4
MKMNKATWNNGEGARRPGAHETMVEVHMKRWLRQLDLQEAKYHTAWTLEELPKVFNFKHKRDVTQSSSGS